MNAIPLAGSLFAAAVGALSFAAPASAQIAANDPSLKTDQFDIEYVEPRNPAHVPLYEALKKRRVLEGIQEFLSPFRLPQRVLIKTEDCGVINSYFAGTTLKVCYEYLDYMFKQAPNMAHHGLTQHDAIIGPTVDVFMHEWGHGVLRVPDIPFFAKEEDVADSLATLTLLSFAKDDARRLILGASFFGDAEIKEEHSGSPALSALADSHSLPAQRYYNRWCMAYGFDKDLFADAIEIGMLPPNRVAWCRWEWDTNKEAFDRLIKPFIDQAMMQKVLSKRWFQFEAPDSAIMVQPPAKNASGDPAAPAGK